MKTTSLDNWRLYVITNEELSGRTHVDITKDAIAGGADVIQLRDKTVSSKKLYEAGKTIRQLTRQAGVPFIVNDRLDIALAVDADGLHVGTDDLPVAVARRLLGRDKILGASARSLKEAVQAEKDGADYIGLGPIYEARSTKADTIEPQGLSLISTVKKHCNLPIIAIGGINAQNAVDVLKAGADGIAVISAIVTAPDITVAAHNLKTLLIKQSS
jgi:thiamine-phosphate pyrophosphorylase